MGPDRERVNIRASFEDLRQAIRAYMGGNIGLYIYIEHKLSFAYTIYRADHRSLEYQVTSP